ncbi:MAG: TorF family putative porin [Steroidobacteraceae bacterium]
MFAGTIPLIMADALRPLVFVLLAAMMSAAIARPACASLGGAVTVASDYVLRGVSQSDNNPVVQADLHWNFPVGWSAGVWASQLRTQPRSADDEVAAYLQWQRAISSDFDLGASYTHYQYVNDSRPVAYNYDELAVSLAWRDQLYLAATWTPRLNLYSVPMGLAPNRDVYTLEASWHRTLVRRFDFSAGLGFYDPQGVDYGAYAYGNATLGWHYGHWRANLTAIWVQDASHRQYSQGPAGGPLVATVAWFF